MNKPILMGALAMCALIAKGADFGYSNGEVGRTQSTVFRLGKDTRQGAAIRIPAEKLAAIDGCKITSVSVAFGTRNVDSGSMRLFISHDLNAEPLTLQAISHERALAWTEYALDTPYTIKASEGDLYIGYYGELSPNSSLLVGDKTATSQNLIFGILDGKWTDICNSGYGNPAIKFTVADAPAIKDVMLHPIDLGKYMKAGSEYKYSGSIYNYGDEAITSFDLSVSIDGAATQISHFSDLNLAQCKSMEFELPPLNAETEGDKDIKIEISNVNGAEDTDSSDNIFEMQAFFYPEDMERNILLEGFTGMACSNCPRGHSQMNAFLDSGLDTPVIEVMHHSGYQPDLLSTECDYEYTYLYGSSSTFAPAFMMNRTPIPGIGTVPVMQTSADNLDKAYEYAVAQSPYVSLSLDSEYDKDSRLLKIRVKSYAHTDLPAECNVINVLLIQDNMTNDYFYQSGAGKDYVHENVTRDTPTGNAWGLQLPEDETKGGSEAIWTGEYTIPESYTTKYMTGSAIPAIPAIPEDMYLVAYVSSMGSTPAEFGVYNAIKVKVGESYHQKGSLSGIDAVEHDKIPADVHVSDGMIFVKGEYDYFSVYNMEGAEVGAHSLVPGIYVVRVVKDNASFTKKIVIR